LGKRSNTSGCKYQGEKTGRKLGRDKSGVKNTEKDQGENREGSRKEQGVDGTLNFRMADYSPTMVERKFA
jgi:hypothetical protein